MRRPFEEEENTRWRQGHAGEGMATWLQRQRTERSQGKPRVDSHRQKPEGVRKDSTESQREHSPSDILVSDF